MSTAANVRAGGAYVEIGTDQRPLDAGLNQVQRKLTSVAARLSSIGRSFATAGLGTATALALPTKTALDAVGQARKFQAVFKENAKSADEFASNLARALDRGKSDIKSSLATYAALFNGLGFGATQAAKLSQAIAKAGLDFSAFFGISEAETKDRFIAALSGSSEVLDQFGVNIRQAALDQELLAQGIRKTAMTASESEKTLARIGIITKTLRAQGAEGIAFKSVGEADQKIASLVSRSKELGVTLGTELLGPVTAVSDRLTTFVRSANEFATANPRLVSGIGALATYGGAAALSLGLVYAGTSKLVGIAALGVSAFRVTANATFVARDALLALATAQSGAFALGRVGRWKDSIVSAGGAVQMLSARLLPIGLVAGKFLLIAAAVSLVTVAVSKLTDFTAKLSDESANASKALKTAFAGDATLIDRLKQLAGAQDKNSQTGREAEKIAKTLTSRYGDLGLTVDRTTGRVTGLAQALERVAAAQEKANKLALVKELDEAKGNLAALRKEAEAYGGTWAGIVGNAKDVGRTIAGGGPLWGGESSVVVGARSVAARIEAQIARVSELRKQLSGDAVEPADVSAAAAPLAQRADNEADLNEKLIGIYRDRRKARQSELQNEIDAINEQALEVRKALTELARGEMDKNGQTARWMALIREASAFEADAAKRVADAVKKAEQEKRDARAKTIRDSLGDADTLQKQEEKNAMAFREMVDRVLNRYPTGDAAVDAHAFAMTAKRELSNLGIADPEQLKRFEDAIEAIRVQIADGGMDAAIKFSAEMRKAEQDRQQIAREGFESQLARKLAELTGDESLKLKLDADAFKQDAERSLAELKFINPKDASELQTVINSIASQIAAGGASAAREFRIQFAEGMSIGAAASRQMQQRIAAQIGGRTNQDEAKKTNSILERFIREFKDLKDAIGVQN